MQTNEPESNAANDPAAPPAPSSSKLLLEFGPLLAFFVTNKLKGILWATGVLMVCMAISLAIQWKRDRKVSPMMAFTGVTVLVFGGLTLWLDDPVFIKIKVTILNAMFGIVLLGGVATGRSFLKTLIGPVFQLTDAGWRAFTVRYGFFFLALAGLNELVWRNVSTDAWVNFKVFGLMGLTIVFMVTQVPLIQRHAIAPASEESR